MKRTVRAALILMSVLTIVYASSLILINASLDRNDSNHDGFLYAAEEYKTNTTPANRYTPEELGITEIWDHGSWLQILVDPEKEPFSLQKEQPIFEYNNRLYQVEPFWVTLGISTGYEWLQVPIGGTLVVGWLLTGVFFIRGRARR